jgi:hypothetical protein
MSNPLPDPPFGGPVTRLEPLPHNEGNAATGGIWRVHEVGGTSVLKVALPPGKIGSPYWQTADDPHHWNYWKREVLAHTTGFAQTVYARGGIEPPQTLAVRERDDGAIELWLRDEPGTPGMECTVERLGDFAEQLGAAQARWVGQPPSHEWLSRGWLRQYLEHGPSRLVQDTPWNDPRAAIWPQAVRDRLRALWTDRHRLLARAEAVPRTLCHLDVWPANLIARDPTTVLLDWSFVGEGGVGEDAANLIIDSVADGMMDMARLPELVETITARYAHGLGDSDHAIQLFAIVKYCWFGPARLGRFVQSGSIGNSQYGRDDSGEAAMERLLPLVTLLADWYEPLSR